MTGKDVGIAAVLITHIAMVVITWTLYAETPTLPYLAGAVVWTVAAALWLYSVVTP